MGSNIKGRQLPCVLMDVNTQNDFLRADGACPVAGREDLIRSLRRMVAWAKRNHAPVISSVDCHRDREVRFTRLPPHCIDGTPGQQKIDFTLFGSYVKVEGDNTLVVPIDLFRNHQQVIFRKRTTDFLANPKADRFVSSLPATNYVVYGLGIEGSVKSIALGLLARHKHVTVVVDACGSWCASDAEQALRLMDAKGIELTTVDQFVANQLPRPIRYPRVRIGQVSLRNGMYASLVRPPAMVDENGEKIVVPKTNGQKLNGKSNGKAGGTSTRTDSASVKTNGRPARS
ncbi:MAG: isochorismatase family protein [Phycisphaerae bacterium]|nr:isochorismatase family protein [Phycisphaerales bacterium]